MIQFVYTVCNGMPHVTHELCSNGKFPLNTVHMGQISFKMVCTNSLEDVSV